jgi:uncharacterized protein YecT (DUF1311 family)
MIRLLFFATGFAFFCALASGSAQASASPSFDCGKATSALEKLICNDPEIAAADAGMAKLYALAQTSAFGSGRSNQLAAQREWLPGRAGCMKLSSEPSKEGRIYGPRQCLISEYRQRNRQLAVAILLAHPDAALPALRQDSPDIAPLYEALQLQLTKPASAKWSDPAYRATRDRMLALLDPYFTDLKSDADKSYGLSVLTDIATSPADAISSDAKLASTIGIISVYISHDDGVASFPFPCAAMVKRPDMISAISPYFGSTLDNFLPWADCGQSLPAQPRMDALAKALNGFWDGDCDSGTIRFAYYRSYNALVVSARIGMPMASEKGKARKLARKGLSSQLVNAAIAELADQYQRYNGVAKTEADKRARFWLGRIIADVGECDS